MSSTRSNRVGTIVAFVISAAFVAAATWLFFNRQYALDQVSVWMYEPSEAVASIAQKVEFTDRGEFIFHATKPEIESPSSFNKECPRQETGSPILGCYTPEDRIYIYDLTNEQLSGMEEVTAVHEMLHAAWYRTSASEKAELEKELRAAYGKLSDPSLKTRMDYYERTEPGEIANELHSILGTEIRDLGEPLESYYNSLFNRATVLKLHDQYNTVYTALYSRADELYALMQAASSSIQSKSASYDVAVAQLTSDISAFNEKARAGGFTSQSQFNRERAALVARSSALESQREEINAAIATYNTYYQEYQTISDQIEVLNDSIDSFKQIEEAPSV